MVSVAIPYVCTNGAAHRSGARGHYGRAAARWQHTSVVPAWLPLFDECAHALLRVLAQHVARDHVARVLIGMLQRLFKLAIEELLPGGQHGARLVHQLRGECRHLSVEHWPGYDAVDEAPRERR